MTTDAQPEREAQAIATFCRQRASTYGALRQSAATAIALDRAADMIDRLTAVAEWPVEAGVSAVQAFEMGYSFAWDVSRPQSREDSRAIGRLLGSEMLDPIAPAIDAEIARVGFNSFESADAGIVAAKRIIHAALAATPPHPTAEAMREERLRLMEAITPTVIEREQPDEDTFSYVGRIVDAFCAALAGSSSSTTDVVPEVDWQVWQDDQMVASSTNEGDARHYLAIYAQDAPTRLERVDMVRTLVSPALAGSAS